MFILLYGGTRSNGCRFSQNHWIILLRSLHKKVSRRKYKGTTDILLLTSSPAYLFYNPPTQAGAPQPVVYPQTWNNRGQG